MYGINIAVSIAALVGANKYNIWLVGIAILWFVVSFCVSIWSYSSVGNYAGIALSGLFTALWIYPHAVFVYEVKSGETKMYCECWCSANKMVLY